ncbi:hypothetical protein X805_35640 [Sphaerotilus natans subsp. natans DSM 6575]|uniref:Uncharacterized protein n=1 Tax=Sphaerotilus natans subsp. natans DSM 6575 TaxID=1286631 RepID=A0A059KHB9_9BURK|nr:hypothetical protein X805_35640 [Sphaerotilus natans subsp. natans DSM 6575]
MGMRVAGLFITTRCTRSSVRARLRLRVPDPGELAMPAALLRGGGCRAL